MPPLGEALGDPEYADPQGSDLKFIATKRGGALEIFVDSAALRHREIAKNYGIALIDVCDAGLIDISESRLRVTGLSADPDFTALEPDARDEVMATIEKAVSQSNYPNRQVTI